MRAHVAIGTIVGTLLVPGSAGAAELQAAYDHYVPGQGFQIGLVNAATGSARPLPAGVNTADDELHPALSPDGRYLVFTRMKLLPQLNGNIVPPAAKSLIHVDLQTGTLTPLGQGAGPVFTQRGSSPELAHGAGPVQGDPFVPNPEGAVFVARLLTGAAAPAQPRLIHATVPVQNLDIPHAASVRGVFSETFNTTTCSGSGCRHSRDGRYLSLAYHDPVTGALTNGQARLSLFGVASFFSDVGPIDVRTFGTPTAPAGHPVPRSEDGYVAFHEANGAESDIKSLLYPAQTSAPDVAPAPVTTTDAERMPAWSPDGLKLGFVRTTGGRRKLGVYDLTPGIQAILNPLVDLGADAPTPQTRQFQTVYGGLSLAEIPATPATTCNQTCAATLLRRTITLRPTVTRTVPRQTIGILVVRRRGGTRTVLGVKQPRIQVVGRVPLGKTKKGVNRFRWDGRVNGKRLKPGRYLLTYRLLRDDAVTTTSRSVPFRVRPRR